MSDCRSFEFTPQPVMEMTTMESIINMVSMGVGVTILPKAYLDYHENEQIRTIPIHDPILTTQIGVVYRKKQIFMRGQPCVYGTINQYGQG